VIIEVKRRDHVQQITYEDFEQRIIEGEIRAETLVRFELITGQDFWPAGDLELFSELANPHRMAFRRNLSRPGLPILTAILVGLQVRIYGWSWMPETELWMQEHLTNWAPAILEQGEVFRLFSYGMLQLNLTHLLFNLCFLAYAGYHLERAMGRANLATIFFGSVFCGGLLSMALGPDRPSLGASGGDFGLLAASVILGWKHGGSIPEQARKYFGWALVPYIGFSILSGFSAENVDNWSHLGGMAGGAILMTLLDPEVLPDRRTPNRRARWGAWLTMLGICAFLALAGTRLVPLQVDEGEGWQFARPTYWHEGWTFTGDRGWFSPTLGANLATARTVHPQPITANEAIEGLMDRISEGGRDPALLERSPVAIEGAEAVQVVLQFTLAGETHQLTALVMTRGVVEHRVQVQTLSQDAARHAPLFARILLRVSLDEPPDLVKARTKATNHPRSWSPAVELGDALYRVGEPEAAVASYRRGLGIAPNHPSALVGLLRTHADYRLPGGAEQARDILARASDEPLPTRVRIAAADTLAAFGPADEGATILTQAWAQDDEDATLRRAMLRWGLSVE
jgi:rhomboid protease GluP